MTLHERQKQYERVSQTYLMRRTPVIIRLDGVAFHTFTKNFKKPIDHVLTQTMKSVTRYLVNNIQGCVLGYTQSDEISLVLQDYKKQDTDAWFGYNVQKLVSVSAKMATAQFSKVFDDAICNIPMESFSLYMNAFKDNNVGFDSRCWNLPVDEVNNYLIDRQQDAERNSLNLLAQQYYTQEELKGINAKQLQNKLFVEKGVNWNDLDTCEKRGYVALPLTDPEYPYCETPIFSKNPSFVNSCIIFNKNNDKK